MTTSEEVERELTGDLKYYADLMEERLLNIEGNVSKLFKKTKYEEQRFYNFLSDQIKKLGNETYDHERKLEEINDLFVVGKKYPAFGILDSLDQELGNRFETRFMTMVMQRMNDALRPYAAEMDVTNQTKLVDGKFKDVDKRIKAMGTDMYNQKNDFYEKVFELKDTFYDYKSIIAKDFELKIENLTQYVDANFEKHLKIDAFEEKIK